jgi:hypothetical protein
LETLHTVSSDNQVAVALVVSIVTGFLGGLVLPMELVGERTWAVSLTFIAVVSTVICWQVCPEKHRLQLWATLITAALPIAAYVAMMRVVQTTR